MAESFQCKNCDEVFESSYNYCPYCGQETTDKLTVGVLFSNTIRNYFSVDARFFKSFIPLILKPGVLARRFVDGQRQLYLHPAQFYLFVSILFFFIFSFTVREADSKISKQLGQEFLTKEQIEPSVDDLNTKGADVFIKTEGLEASSVGVVGFEKEKLDSLISAGAPEAEKLKAMGNSENAGVMTTKVYSQVLKLYERKGGGILKTLFDTVPVAMFFLLPLFAFLLKLFFRRSGTFAHHMVFSFNFFTFLFTTFAVLAIANTFFAVPDWINTTVFLSCIIYLTLALRHFYRSRMLSAFIKASSISLLYMLIVVPVAMVGVIFVSFLMY